MKSLLHTLFFLLFVTQICFAQADFWEQTNGPGGGNVGFPVGINSQGEMFAAFGWQTDPSGVRLKTFYFELFH